MFLQRNYNKMGHCLYNHITAVFLHVLSFLIVMIISHKDELKIPTICVAQQSFLNRSTLHSVKTID